MTRVWRYVCFIAPVLALCAPPAPVRAAVLVTARYVVVVTEHCEEGDVACGEVSYTGVNRETGESISLQGEAWVRYCADGVTPCQHLGWVFRRGSVVYRVTETPAVLSVERDGKRVLEQPAVWSDW